MFTHKSKSACGL